MNRKNRRTPKIEHDFFDWDMPDEKLIRAEKEKAKALRKSRWWQQKTSSGICAYCKKEVGFVKLTMDHILPLARGGRSTKENITACCKECNSLKKSMMPIEWQQYCEEHWK